MEQKKLYSYIVCILLLLAVISACAKSPNDSNVTETQSSEAITDIPERVSIKIGQLPYLSHTIFTIAEEEDYFNEQGLDVEIITVKESNDIIPLLLSGEIDVSAPSPTAAFFNSVARGGKIKIIMPLTDFTVQDCSAIAYLARTSDVEAGVYTEKSSWQGAKIVLAANGLTSIQGYVLSKAVAPAGLTIEDMTVEQLNLPTQEDALRNGQVDIVYAVEPWITRMTSAGDISILDPAEQFTPGLTASIVVAGPRLTDNPEVGQRFAIAYLKAVRQFLEGPTDRNVELAVGLTQMAPELVQQICWSTSSPNGTINMQSLLDYQSWLMSRDLLDKELAPETFYDASYAAYAVGVLGEVEP